MTQKVNQRLLMTPEEYEGQLLNIWFSWCMEKVQDPAKLHDGTFQKLLSNQPLFNWWQTEFQKLEREFMESTRPFNNKNHAKRVYAEFTVDIFRRYSKPLLKKAYE